MNPFQVRLRRQDIGEQEIIADIRRVAAENGCSSLSRDAYGKYGQFSSGTVERRLGSWNSAIKAAGLEPANRLDISDEELYENMAEIWTKLGRQPFGRGMYASATGSKFAKGTYEKRFGSWNKALVCFSDYVAGNANPRERPGNLGYAAQSSHRRTPRGINWRLRAKVLIKDGCMCRMCGSSPMKNSATVLHVDHIIAWSNGGETVEENLQTLCEVCNIGKSNSL